MGKRRCSTCGKEGHNRRTCPDYAISVKMTGMTKDEADKMSIHIKEGKRKICSDRTIGTIIIGRIKQLVGIKPKSLEDNS
ncbi:hypothetical protein QUF74_10245 [Candidatus Halobeggiatoa sp. HSG11]|nr:hypothetical protein [Candidatus Halobeggiatoa sp. HSG11]